MRRQVDYAILLVIVLLLLCTLLGGRFSNPFQGTVIPFGDWAQHWVSAFTTFARPFFQDLKIPLKAVLDSVMSVLSGISPVVVISGIFLIGWQIGGLRLGLLGGLGLVVLGLIGVWPDAMRTLALTISSVFFCVVVGVPLGIAVAKSNRLGVMVRPLLDVMQTCPAFVYLIPIVVLFGIGNVPGLAVTIVFALPPIVRLTDLGIRQVPPSVVEAARAFGATPFEMLVDVELPLALRTIMAGVNQTLMMALSMVVVASMIAVEGLGLLVLRGIGRLDIGLAATGGLGIVVLAVVFDRLTQAAAHPHEERLLERGPVGLIYRLLARRRETRRVRSLNKIVDGAA